jgi:hypothetical protein
MPSATARPAMGCVAHSPLPIPALGRTARRFAAVQPRPGSRFLLLVLLACGYSALATCVVGAQQPAQVLTGTVFDAQSRAPIAAALLTIGDLGPRAITDAAGHFRLVNVSQGTHSLTVQAFGYRELQVVVAVTPGVEPLELHLVADPLVIQGLTVTAQTRADVIGRVRDADSGAPVPWVQLSLTRDVVRSDGRASSDDQGIFRIENVETGDYLLRVDRLGYVSMYVPVGHYPPPEPLDLPLQPDSAVLAGLEAVNTRLTTRRAASPNTVRRFGEERLQTSVARGMRQFLETDALLTLIPCPGRSTRDCLYVRGNLVAPRVLIDEQLMLGEGMDQLASYDPWEFYSVEVFMCGPGDRLRGWEIRAFTHQYMAQLARRGRGLLPQCF